MLLFISQRKFCYRGGVGSVPARLRGLLGAPSHPAWEEEQEEEREEQDGGSGPVLLGDADPTAMLAAGTAEKSRRPLPIPWRKRNIKSDFKKVVRRYSLALSYIGSEISSISLSDPASYIGSEISSISLSDPASYIGSEISSISLRSRLIYR